MLVPDALHTDTERTHTALLVNDSTLPLTPLTLQLTPLTPLTPLTQIFHLRVETHRTDAHQSRRVRSCSHIVHTGSSTDVHIITYRHITHRYTPAPPRVSYHVGRHDDEGRCHYPKRCSRRMPGTSPRPAWVQYMAPRRQPTTERSAGGRRRR